MITRFAPSPTGPLHLGHAYSAMLAHDMAMAAGGTFLLRIENIDQSRARPEWEAQIYDDLRWLGLWWPEHVMRQSERMPAYEQALDQLWLAGLLYPCGCTRRDIEEAASAPQEGAPMHGPDGIIYPGTCRGRMSYERVFSEQYPRPKGDPLRLDMTLATHNSHAFEHRISQAGGGWKWFCGYQEQGNAVEQNGLIEFTPDHMINQVGDVVLSRLNMGTSYHLSVVVDDAAQGITDVVRGADLAEATPIHALLQKLLGLPTPIYHHHRLIRDEAGKRLAKRDDARAISKYRAEGATPNDIRRLVGLPEV
ncbi:tRNA glutamyl-Q(34) synthetase GluQRS [Loktanella agnita]|uniref:tRNA glutamyl-Q(34) synthetase GluQRS n=1 Tax=Loktanella agnita TaxID=287097 RepID=UPI003986B162